MTEPGGSRRPLVCVALLVALVAGPLCAQQAPEPDLTARLDGAAKLAPAEAEKELVAAIEAFPRNVEPALALAALYTKLDRKEEAFALYVHVIARLDAENKPAHDGIKRLFLRGRFPRELRLQELKLGPVGWSVERCTLSREWQFSRQATREFATTTTLLFPEEMSADRAAPWVPLPPSLATPGSLMVNRVAYGLLVDPGGDVGRLRWMAGWPSSTVVDSGKDYSSLATRLLGLCLRSHIYFQEYLGIDRQQQEGRPVRVYLTEDGPTGAEQWDDRIFFYDCDQDREGMEWLREAFHELGHLFLPPVGPFPGADRWGNGDLGERLLMQWLVEEAGAAAHAEWPDQPAREALDALWGQGHLDAERYLLDNCRIPLNAWLNADAEDFSTQDGAEMFAAFCLWIQAAHGRPFLGAVLRSAEGTAPADYVAAYKDTVRKISDARGLSVGAGSLNPMTSRLMQPPREGAVRRELVALGTGGAATYRVWLPAGKWAVTVDMAGTDKPALGLILDARNLLTVTAGQAAELGDQPEGWHTVKVTCGLPGPVELLGLRFTHPAEQTEPAGTAAPEQAVATPEPAK